MTNDRILVVDDEPQIRRALQTALNGHGYRADAVADAASALEYLASRPPDLLVLDLMLPGTDGFAVLQHTRAWSDVPVIVLSARGEERNKIRALDMGADDYLTKPFGMGELLARVRAMLRRRPASGETAITFGDVTVDLARRVVTKRGVEVHLTPTEFELLLVLCANLDRVLTHRQVLERVWGSHAASNTQQLRVYINYLRRKLEDEPSHPRWIVSEPGIGYRLRADAHADD